MNHLLQVVLNNPMLSGGMGLGVVGGAVAALRKVPEKVGDYAFRETTSSVLVRSNDPGYLWFTTWLENHSYSKKCRDMIAALQPGDETRETRFKFSPAFGNHILWYKGRLVWFTRKKENENSSGGGSRAGSLMSLREPMEEIKLRVLGRDKKVLYELCDEVRKLVVSSRQEGFINFYINRYGHWSLIGKRKARSLDSVVLDDDIPQKIADDIQQFLDNAKWYEARGIPHRRSYLLHGEPGSGKSSLALALAGRLQMDIYILSLADPGLSDSDLLNMMINIGKNSLVLLEDVDAVFTSRKQTKEEKEESKTDEPDKVTFSGLLNALDGVASKEGIILFMSTNHIEKLDPALIRPGRADVKIEFKKATDNQAYRLFLRFFPGEEDNARHFMAVAGGQRFTMAEIQEHLLRYKDDSYEAATTVEEIYRDKADEPLVVPLCH